MSSRKSAILWILLVCGFASFATAQTSDPGYASYRIWCGNGAGSCTGIAPDLVATNVHVAGTGGASCRIAHPLTNREWRGMTVAGDRAADVALVLVSSADLDWVLLGDDPQPGQECFHYGYGGNEILDRGEGRYIAAWGVRDGRVPVWSTSTQAVSGDSGGGVFDTHGRLCSVVWGGDECASTPVSYVARLLDRYRQNPQPPPQQTQQVSRPGRLQRKQPVVLGPRTPVDPFEDFDADKLIEAMLERSKGK